MKFVFLSFKRNILPFIFILLAICLVIFSKSNLIAAKNGLILWANNVVPSLFPFFVITELLSSTNLVYYMGKLFNRFMRPLFNVPGECAFAFIMGLISGYPTGGKIVATLREQNLCTKDEGDRMLAFTNNSGPLFIVSCVGISFFGDTKIGILLLVTHILSAVTIGILIGKLSTFKSSKTFSVSTNQLHNSLKKDITFKDLGTLLGKSIHNSISTILMIGGFVVIFSVIISILKNSQLLHYSSQFLNPLLHLLGFNPNFSESIVAGLIELTNGINMAANIPIKLVSQNIIICAFLLGFGGLSVLLQVFSIVSKTDLSMKTYLIWKLIQGMIAAMYTYIAFQMFPMLNLDILPTCASLCETVVYPIQLFGLSNYFILLLAILLIIFIAFSSKGSKSNNKLHSK